MPVPQLFVASLEIGINQALDWAFNKEELLSPLVNRTCIIFIQELDKALIFSFDGNGVVVTLDQQNDFKLNPEENERTPLTEQECWVSLSIFAIQQLKQNSQLTKLIKSGQLDFAGNLSILQSLSKLYGQIDLDIEEILAKYLGDVLAHNIHSTGKQVGAELFKQLELIKYTISDAALDEKPIAVRGIMVTNFCDDVMAIQESVDRLEAKIDILENKLLEKKKTKLESDPLVPKQQKYKRGDF